VTDDEPVDFGAAVRDLVRTIPVGRVMTYGDVAAALGSRASRRVGQVMAREGGDLPWWRVVRSGGLPPQGHESRALEHYRTEGTPLSSRASASADTSAWRLDMRRARWAPDPAPVVRDGAEPGRASRPDPDQGYDPTDPNFPRDPF
jgi:alkylated DNA nucleotide flippase Atl1